MPFQLVLVTGLFDCRHDYRSQKNDVILLNLFLFENFRAFNVFAQTSFKNQNIMTKKKFLPYKFCLIELIFVIGTEFVPRL